MTEGRAVALRRPIAAARSAFLLATLVVAVTLLGPLVTAADAATAASPALVAPSEEAFSLALLRGVAGAAPADLVLSPSSLEAALAMLELGAHGATESGIATALQAGTLSAPALAASLGALRDALSTMAGIELDEADALFAEKGTVPRPSYVAALRADFAAVLHVVDFSGDPAGAVRAVNAFVDQATKGLIPVLFPSPLDTTTRVVLADAVYLNAKWVTPFRHSATAPGTFHPGPGASETVPFLHGSLDAPFLVRPGLTAVELPYTGGRLAALVLEPMTASIGSFVSSLRPSVLDATIAALSSGPFELAIPKVALHSAESLGTVLRELGMGLAFSDGADLSGITPSPPLKVAVVRQVATLKLDEAGTSAAAATGVGIIATALPAERAVIDIDRPFVLLVRDRTTGAIVFEAVVARP